MFAFLTRNKPARVAAGVEADARAVSAGARQKRLFDRTVMSPDIVVPAAPNIRAPRETFGQKPEDD